MPGYEGSYEVSDLGRVKSLAKSVGKGRARVQAEMILLSSVSGGGRSKKRAAVKLYKDGKGRTFNVGTLVLVTFEGDERPSGKEVCHRDDDAINNNSWGNLYWGTHSENMRDRTRNGKDRNANKTECPRGHRLVEPNLRKAGLRDGKRQCLACAQAVTTIWRRGGGDQQELADQNYARIMSRADALLSNREPARR